MKNASSSILSTNPIYRHQSTKVIFVSSHRLPHRSLHLQYIRCRLILIRIDIVYENIEHTLQLKQFGYDIIINNADDGIRTAALKRKSTLIGIDNLFAFQSALAYYGNLVSDRFCRLPIFGNHFQKEVCTNWTPDILVLDLVKRAHVYMKPFCAHKLCKWYM